MSAGVRARVSNAASTLLIIFGLVVPAVRIASGQGTGYFSPADSMSTARDAAAVAQLENGNVLVAGGNAASGASELYDVVADRFIPVGELHEPRAEAAAIRLRDGRVLVVGGSNGAPLASAELYDPSTGSFSRAGSMSVARVRPAVAALPDGRVLVAGGHDHTAALASAELYDPATGTFTPTSSMSTGRVATAAVLPGGAVLLTGGEPGRESASSELYNPAAGTFQPAGSLNIPRYRHAATTLADGRVLVTGGRRDDGQPIRTAELFDPTTREFKLAAEALVARYDHAAVRLADGSVLTVGGQNATGPITATEIFNPLDGTFTRDAALLEGRVAPAVAPVGEGGIVVGGGRGGAANSALATVERYSREDGRATTSTRLASSSASSTYGQPVTYTATVSSNGEPPTGAVEFRDGTMSLGASALDAAGRASITTGLTPAGTRAITATYTGSTAHRGSESQALQQTVARAAAYGTFTISSLQRQYSDPVTFTAIVSPAAAARSVTFRTGATVIGTATIVDGRAVLQTTVAADIAPGSRLITATFNQELPNYAIANLTKSMSILKEDARVTQSGGTTYTACPTCSTATVLLRATVRDISVTAEANGDASAGDIRNATLAFIDRGNYATLGIVPVVAADGAKAASGEAVYLWKVDLGAAASKSFRIGYAVGGLYTRSSYDYVYVTVAKPKQ